MPPVTNVSYWNPEKARFDVGHLSPTHAHGSPRTVLESDTVKIAQVHVVVLFASILTIFAGAIMIGTGIQVLSHPLSERAGWQAYRLLFDGPRGWLYIGCVLVALGITSLWYVRQRSRQQ